MRQVPSMLLPLFLSLAVVAALASAVRAAVDPELLRKVRERDQSISSAALSLNIRFLKGARHDPSELVPALRESLMETPSSVEATDAALSRFAQRLGVPPGNGYDVQTRQLATTHQTNLTLGTGRRVTYHSDGDGDTLRVLTSDGPERASLELHPADHAMAQFRVEDYNIKLEPLMAFPIVSTASSSDTHALTFTISKRQETRVTLAPDLSTREVVSSINGRTILRKWFIHSSARDGGSRLAAIIIDIPQRDGGHDLELVRVDQLELNAKVLAQDVSLPVVPPWAVVVDYRVSPPKTSRALDTPAELLAPINTLEHLDQPLEHFVSSERVAGSTRALAQGIAGATPPAAATDAATPAHRVLIVALVLVTTVGAVVAAHLWRSRLGREAR